MNQEPGTEESGTHDSAEEARKAGLLETAACGPRSGGESSAEELCEGRYLSALSFAR